MVPCLVSHLDLRSGSHAFAHRLSSFTVLSPSISLIASTSASPRSKPVSRHEPLAMYGAISSRAIPPFSPSAWRSRALRVADFSGGRPGTSRPSARVAAIWAMWREGAREWRLSLTAGDGGPDWTMYFSSWSLRLSYSPWTISDCENSFSLWPVV